MSHDYTQELDCARGCALQAGERLRRAFHQLGAGHEADLDRIVEVEIRRTLLTRFPQYGYLGEETGAGQLPQDAGGHLWLVDPDDGTSAFEQGLRGPAVSIALLRDGQPVLGVVFAYCAPDEAGDLFTWAEGTDPLRRNGQPVPSALDRPDTVLLNHQADHASQENAARTSPLRFRAVPSIAYRLALVAAGEARAAVSVSGAVGWDYGGGHALLLGAGLVLVDGRGRPVRYDGNGGSHAPGGCFGGEEAVVRQLAAQQWASTSGRRRSADGHGLCWPVPGCAVADSALLSRAQGCLLGQLAGDALGSLVEFRAAAEIRAAHPDGLRRLADGGTWGTLAGQPTDDSELALMLARSILGAGGYDAEAAARAYAAWHDSGPFDIGTTTRAAVSAAARAVRNGSSAAAAARSAALAGSQSNGALMRVSPLGVLGAGAPPGLVGDWATQDAALTHPHAVCRHASAVYAQTLAQAIRTGESGPALHRFALEAAAGAPQPLRAALAEAASRPPASYETDMGFVLIALQNAFWQLLHAGSFEDGVVNTVMAGGDTDTNAAIAGALLGAVHGRQAVPPQWQDRVLTCRPLPGTNTRHPRPEAFWPVDALWLAERLLWLGGRVQS